jgi:aspartyl-tRNA(Asn)/glutamyl-tRNA(Gln) amidotransferase subunit A
MASFPEEIFFSTAVELHRRLETREFSATELTKAFLDRLEKRAPTYNALALLLEGEAVRKAKEVDKELKRGRLRGPLQGIPFGAKDLLSFAGKPTTWGAKPFAQQVFDTTATSLIKLSKAGAVLCAKLSMVELAGGGGYRYPAASMFGPGLNPWDLQRWSGGSSSGSGSAVAAGLVPFALGSETSGSILTPCAFCGITGLRPTYGLVSRAGAMALSWTMDKIGPMARSAEDCGHILQAISGGDPNDPGSAGKSFYFTPQYAREPRALRFGFALADFAASAEEAIRPALSEGLDALRALGGHWEEVELPDLPYGPVTSVVIGAEGGAAFARFIESGAVNELADTRQIAGLRSSLEITAKTYLQAMQVRRTIQAAFAKIFGGIDVLVAPARFSVAPPIQEPLDRPTGAAGASTGRGLRAIIPAGNLAGLPALVLPCGLSQGLPVGLQLVGRPFSENTLLKIGMAFQNSTNWHQARPRIG